jgi:hypothetical protein
VEELKKVYLYRMTHIENIPHILQYGITHINSPNRNPAYVPIGDRSLITNRENFNLPNGTRLGAFIPFYFGKRMPMLFVIQNGFNGVNKTLSENIVYCISSVYQIIQHQIGFIFTNGHAVDELTEFFTRDNINDILHVIDRKAIDAKYWKDENDLDLKRRKEAEFLVNSDVPISAILGYAVYNQNAEQKLIELGVEKDRIVIRSDYYF